MPRDEISGPARDSRLGAGLLLATLATGLGWIALLPPFEGFDESAHYSYVQELADSGRLPVFGSSVLSADVAAWRATRPTPYRDRPPFEANGGITYREYFAGADGRAPAPAVDPPRRFAPGAGHNWQSQHPPLYYALLAPLYHLTRDWSWPAQLLVLRSASLLLAIGGLWLAARATARHLRGIGGDAAALAAAPLAWPFLFPMFFSSLGRLGNDSLCLLLTAGVWRHLLAMEERAPRQRDAAVLGGILGAGLLTKALFVPIAVAVTAHLAWRRRWSTLAIALPLAAAIGGSWYAHVSAAAGRVVVSDQYARFLDHGGLALLVERFEWLALAKGLYWVTASFVWGGSWSLAHVSEWWRLPAVALLLLVAGCAAWARVTAPGRRDDGARLAWLLVAAFAIAMLAYEVINIAISGSGGAAPGWYAHVLAGPAGLLLALGLAEAVRAMATRWALTALFAWVTAFFATICALQLALYTGCAAKLGSNNHYSFPAGPGCLLDVASLGDKAAALAYPALGVPLLAVGLATGAALVARLLRRLAGEATASATG